MAQSLAHAGHHVLLADAGAACRPPSAQDLPPLVAKIKGKGLRANVRITTSCREASWEADIVIPVVPYEAQAEVARQIQDVVGGKIVISVVNPLNASCDGLVTAPTTSAAELFAQELPYSKIVKAFNTIPAAYFGMPVVAGKTVDVFVAGDDNEAVSTVAQLVRDVGFNPVIAGGLAMSHALENMMVLLISLCARNPRLEPVGWKVVHAPRTLDAHHPRAKGILKRHARGGSADQQRENHFGGNHKNSSHINTRVSNGRHK
jgi:predicted dinucleotide-binding enzyme